MNVNVRILVAWTCRFLAADINLRTESSMSESQDYEMVGENLVIPCIQCSKYNPNMFRGRDLFGVAHVPPCCEQSHLNIVFYNIVSNILYALQEVLERLWDFIFGFEYIPPFSPTTSTTTTTTRSTSTSSATTIATTASTTTTSTMWR